SSDLIIDVFPPHQQQQIRIQLASVIQGILSQQLLQKSDGSGRIAAFEVMVATPAIRNLIREEKVHQINTSIQTGGNCGMETMDNAILHLYNKGVISVEVALNHGYNVELLKRYIQLGGDILNFRYKAVTENGKIIEGTFEKKSSQEVLSMLNGNDYLPISIEETKEKKLKNIRIFSSSVRKKDIAIFCRQFYTMLHSGI